MGTCDREAIDNDIPTFEYSAAAVEKRMKEREMLGTSFPDDYYKTINVVTSSHSAIHFNFHDDLDDYCNENDWEIKANKPQVLDDFAVLLST